MAVIRDGLKYKIQTNKKVRMDTFGIPLIPNVMFLISQLIYYL